MSETSDWLDTQTKAELEASPPGLLAPPTAMGYSLVLLRPGSDGQRLSAAIEKSLGAPLPHTFSCPLVLENQLSLTDALEAQFELICVDSISVFIDDEVLENASKGYLKELYSSLLLSPEFSPVQVSVRAVPRTVDGVQFLGQFLGDMLVPTMLTMPFKKARIMRHWAAKIGAEVEIQDGPTSRERP